MERLNHGDFPDWMIGHPTTPEGYKGSPSNVIRGQRFVPQLNPLAAFPNSIVRQPAQLVRAEDPSGKVSLWQVTLSPIFQFQTGPQIQGIPARHTNGDTDGQYLVTMTWGGGGVNFSTEFAYPAHGASFSVAGDNVMLTAITNDLFTTYTEQNKPCFDVWVAPGAQPVNPRPLVEFFQTGAGIAGINEVPPWARSLTVTKANPAATVIIEISLEVVGTFIVLVNMTAADQRIEIPLPSRAQQVRVTPSAGVANGMFELVFT